MQKYKKNNRKKYLILSVFAIILLTTAGYFAYKKFHVNDTPTADDKTTSTAPSAQEDFTTNDNRQIAATSDKGSAAVSDNQGQQDAIPDQSQWTASKTGEITVYEPAKNQIVTKGATLSGVSTLGAVYYRVIDDVSGMIAQGQLSVVNGRFSGSLSFTTTAANGRIDVYGAQDSGKEFSNIEVPIRFK